MIEFLKIGLGAVTLLCSIAVITVFLIFAWVAVT